MNEGPGANAPHVMRSSLAAPYIYGTLFVHALRRRGGWAAVDRAWDDAPTHERTDPAPRQVAGARARDGRGRARLRDARRGVEGRRRGLGGRARGAHRLRGVDGRRRPRQKSSAGWGGDRGVLARERRPGGLRLEASLRPRQDARRADADRVRRADPRPRQAASVRPRCTTELSRAGSARTEVLSRSPAPARTSSSCWARPVRPRAPGPARATALCARKWMREIARARADAALTETRTARLDARA